MWGLGRRLGEGSREEKGLRRAASERFWAYEGWETLLKEQRCHLGEHVRSQGRMACTTMSRGASCQPEGCGQVPGRVPAAVHSLPLPAACGRFSGSKGFLVIRCRRGGNACLCVYREMVSTNDFPCTTCHICFFKKIGWDAFFMIDELVLAFFLNSLILSSLLLFRCDEDYSHLWFVLSENIG